jgi:hypothetical protein
MCQWRWMEFLEEFWCPIKYHLRKANVVLGALSQKVKVVALQMVESLELEIFVVERRLMMNNI